MFYYPRINKDIHVINKDIHTKGNQVDQLLWYTNQIVELQWNCQMQGFDTDSLYLELGYLHLMLRYQILVDFLLLELLFSIIFHPLFASPFQVFVFVTTVEVGHHILLHYFYLNYYIQTLNLLHCQRHCLKRYSESRQVKQNQSKERQLIPQSILWIYKNIRKCYLKIFL